jgi:hypothetical protein
MILIPYYLREKSLSIGCKLTTMWLFLADSGKQPWTIDDDTDTLEKEYCNDNGIFGSVSRPKEGVILYKVDTEKTNIDDFHTWSDVLAGATPDHAWRPFFWLGDIGQNLGDIDRWGWKEEISLKLGTLSLAELWDMVSSAETD